jgi:hypothetical protein|tara:strand:+ start:5285 stop:5845 length:561 start_codon:yes stop_codon:yes gene_type:complete
MEASSATVTIHMTDLAEFYTGNKRVSWATLMDQWNVVVPDERQIYTDVDQFARDCLRMKTTRSISITITPDARLSKNGLRRAHWWESGSLVRKAREDAYMLGLEAIAENGWVTPDKVMVTVTQYYSGKPFDWDGLACACGPTIDGLVDAGAAIDDDPAHIIRYTMISERVKKKADSYVEITFTALE